MPGPTWQQLTADYLAHNVVLDVSYVFNHRFHPLWDDLALQHWRADDGSYVVFDPNAKPRPHVWLRLGDHCHVTPEMEAQAALPDCEEERKTRRR